MGTAVTGSTIWHEEPTRFHSRLGLAFKRLDTGILTRLPRFCGPPGSVGYELGPGAVLDFGRDSVAFPVS